MCLTQEDESFYELKGFNRRTRGRFMRQAFQWAIGFTPKKVRHSLSLSLSLSLCVCVCVCVCVYRLSSCFKPTSLMLGGLSLQLSKGGDQVNESSTSEEDREKQSWLTKMKLAMKEAIRDRDNDREERENSFEKKDDMAGFGILSSRFQQSVTVSEGGGRSGSAGEFGGGATDYDRNIFVEEDGDDIKFLALGTPEDATPRIKAANVDRLIQWLTSPKYSGILPIPTFFIRPSVQHHSLLF